MTEKSRQKVKYIENEKSFQDEIKSISRPFERVFILAKIKKKQQNLHDFWRVRV